MDITSKIQESENSSEYRDLVHSLTNEDKELYQQIKTVLVETDYIILTVEQILNFSVTVRRKNNGTFNNLSRQHTDRIYPLILKKVSKSEITPENFMKYTIFDKQNINDMINYIMHFINHKLISKNDFIIKFSIFTEMTPQISYGLGHTIKIYKEYIESRECGHTYKDNRYVFYDYSIKEGYICKIDYLDKDII